MERRKGSAWRHRMIGMLSKRQGGKCHWCKHRMLTIAGPLQATIDHVKPIAVGGMNSKKNLVAACYECNQQRGKDMHIGGNPTAPPKGK